MVPWLMDNFQTISSCARVDLLAINLTMKAMNSVVIAWRLLQLLHIKGPIMLAPLHLTHVFMNQEMRLILNLLIASRSNVNAD